MTPFNTNTRLLAIAMGFVNTGFIADMVAPRVTVPSEEFEWTEYETAELFNIPDTKVGRKSKTNEVEFTGKPRNGSVLDYGLSDIVPMKDINKAKDNPAFDPEGVAAYGVAELVALSREKRVCDMVLSASSYNHSAALTGADRFSDRDSDAVNIILDALEVPMVRPNTMTLGRRDWRNLRMNRSLLAKLTRRTDADGIATRQEILDLLELDTINVGEARHNTANKGQAMILSRLWDSAVAFQYIKPFAALNRDITHIMSAQYGSKVAFTKMVDQGDAGLRGAKRITVGEQLNEVLVSREAGYLFTGTQ
jgi:hypothetical protein